MTAILILLIIGTVLVGMYRWFAIPSDRRKWRKYWKAQHAKEISQLRQLLNEIESETTR
jgi:hypothetical protein